MDTVLTILLDFWIHLLAVADVAIAILVSVHIVLNKRNARAAVAWLGLVWLAPLIGSVLYGLLGINRIQRRARQIRPPASVRVQTCEGSPPLQPANMESLARLVSQVTQRPLLSGNAVALLPDEAAYPAMLQAIEGAERSIAMQSYIFDDDPVGREFVAALARAVGRGVAVRVLIDGVGAHYSLPPMSRILRRQGVPSALFLFSWNPLRMPFINLRNHRKLLVVDGGLAFTGGMNIRHAHALDRAPDFPTRDLMVRVKGPVVGQLLDVFVEDWAFTTSEALVGEHWARRLEPAGPVLARAISDGPDEDLDRVWRTLLGALACARERVAIVCPYFLPGEELITALGITAMRGVRVDILLPAVNNFPHMTWATRSELPALLEQSVQVWRMAGPFDHTKLMVVDRDWGLFGSSNWDARSLRLNFELNLECYDPAVVSQCWALVDARLATAEPWTMQEVADRSLPVRLLDGAAHLLEPYL